MRRVSFLVSSVLLLIMLTSTAASALTIRTTNLYQVGKDETINDDLVFAGDTLVIDGTVNGDVFAFAESIFVNGTVLGNLVTAGNKVHLKGEITGTVIGAGQTIILDGRVGKNLVGAGSTIAVNKDAYIGSNLLAAGDRINHGGKIGRGAAIAGSKISVDGAIDRELQAAGDGLTLGATAQIGGPVDYWSEHDAQITPGAKTGKVTLHEHNFNFPRWERPWFLSTIWVLLKFGGFLTVGLVFLTLFPSLRAKFPQIPLDMPWQAPLTGFLFLVATPVVTILLMITVLGLPLGILTLVALPLLIYVSQILISWTVGKLLSERIPVLQNLGWPIIFVGGAALTTIAGETPLLGWLFSAAFLFYGLGSLLVLITRREKQA